MFGRFRRKPSEAAASQRWVVVDVETSGLDAAADRLIAIGAVAMRADGRILPADSLEVVLRQEVPSSRENILVHGMGVQAQRSGLDPERAMHAFLDYVGVAPILAWHAAFDRGFLARALKMYANVPFGNPWLDLAQLAPALLPQVQARTLDQWLEHFSIPVAGRHSAAGDAFATALLATRLLALAHRQGANSFTQLQRLARARHWLVR